MRHFTHPKNPQVVLKRLSPIGNVTSDMIGQVYEIVEISNICQGKKKGVAGCSHRGDPNCPGEIRLDRPPFGEAISCYSWSGKSIFDFL